jgi:Domain of unknown function (DUF4136)
MNRLLSAMLVLLALGASRSAAQDVRYDFDRDKDFSKYKTYKWVPVKDADKTDDLRAKIQSAVDAELATKGFTKTDSDEADLYLDYPTIIGSEKQSTSYNTGWVYGPDWGSWLVYVGQLDLSMYDSHTKQLVWRGTASKTLDPKAKPEKKQENINKVVKKLLKDFPPKPKQ